MIVAALLLLPLQTTGRQVVIPQRRAFPLSPASVPLVIEKVTANIVIVEQTATTMLDLELRNTGGRLEEADLLVPVPDGAVVRSFAFEGQGPKTDARLLLKDEARQIYEKIVVQTRDPALLEFAGHRLIRSCVFPVPAGGRQRVQITYEHLLKADGERVDYALPRSDAIDEHTVPWRFFVKIKTAQPVSTVYSPTHALKTLQSGGSFVFLESEKESAGEPGTFQLSYLRSGSGVSASFFACPDPETGGGWFLLLAGVPGAIDPESEKAMRRQLIVVLDRSGSMAGEKIEQAREAARQVIEALKPGELFNLIDYSDRVSAFSAQPVVKNDETIAQARTYLKGIAASGGTNIEAALLEAVRQPVASQALPLLLFLTDGLPTAGTTDEAAIRSAVAAANAQRYRIFTFGVGHDVNAPLLDRLADTTRALSTYVHPSENVEVKVGSVFKRLTAPILAEPKLVCLDAKGAVSTRTVRDVLPSTLGDVFPGDQVTLLGRYLAGERLRFRLDGTCVGKPRSFEFEFDPAIATPLNSFVSRLWASRRIGELIDEARQSLGGMTDARARELSDEVVRLSRRFGVLTEYTSFFATEGTDLTKPEDLQRQLRLALAGRAQSVRVGRAGVAQSTNIRAERMRLALNKSNRRVDGDLNEVRVANVAQVGDRTLFRRGVQWVDAAVFEQASGKSASAPADSEVQFGTPEYFALAERLRAEGRQGILALNGELRLLLDGKTVLVRGAP